MTVKLLSSCASVFAAYFSSFMHFVASICTDINCDTNANVVMAELIYHRPLVSLHAYSILDVHSYPCCGHKYYFLLEELILVYLHIPSKNIPLYGNVSYQNTLKITLEMNTDSNTEIRFRMFERNVPLKPLIYFVNSQLICLLLTLQYSMENRQLAVSCFIVDV